VKCLCAIIVMLQSRVEQTARQNSVIPNSCWKIHPVMLTHFCSLIKKIFTVLTENPKESPTVCNCSNQEERHHAETPAHTINVQTVTDGISRPVTSGWESNSLILVEHGDKVIQGCYHNMSATRSTWTKFFILQQDSALEAINILYP